MNEKGQKFNAKGFLEKNKWQITIGTGLSLVAFFAAKHLLKKGKDDPEIFTVLDESGLSVNDSKNNALLIFIPGLLNVVGPNNMVEAINDGITEIQSDPELNVQVSDVSLPDITNLLELCTYVKNYIIDIHGIEEKD